MRAVQVQRFGGPEVLEIRERPDPVAGPGQVVIGVSAADVLLLDAQLRQGLHADYFPVRPPYVPGNGVSGQVISVGQDVDQSWMGRRVIAHTGEDGGHGGYAEQAVAGAERLISVPAGLGVHDAAALLHDGPTALALAENADIRPGQWVLLLGAGGGMAILLLQWARAAGARVIAAARGKRKLDLAIQKSADAVIDYSAPDWVRQVHEMTGGAGADVVFDGVGGELGLAAFAVTARGGQFSAHGAASGGFAAIDPAAAARQGVRLRGIEQAQFAPQNSKRLAERALAQAADGVITPVIGQTFPLDRAADAHRALEARQAIGKTLLLN